MPVPTTAVANNKLELVR
jgi:gas vesicle protein